MIYDNRMLFSSAQSVAQVAGTYNSTNVYDSGAVTRDLGNGSQLYLLVEVSTDIFGATSGTLQLQLVSSAAAALTSPVIHASTTLTTTAAGSAANKTLAGSQAWCIEFPQGVNYLEYIGVLYVVAGQTLTSGAVNAFTSLDPHGYVSYNTVSGLV